MCARSAGEDASAAALLIALCCAALIDSAASRASLPLPPSLQHYAWFLPTWNSYTEVVKKGDALRYFLMQ